MQRTDLAVRQGPVAFIPQFVQLAPLRVIDEVLGVTEQVDDGPNPDAVLRRRQHEFAQLLVGVGIRPPDARQAGVVYRVFQVQVKLLIAPRRVARQQCQQEIQPLHLARKIPLKGFDRRGLHVGACLQAISGDELLASKLLQLVQRTRREIYPRFCLMSCSSLTMSAADTRMPSAVFSVAIPSPLNPNPTPFSPNSP